MADKLMNQIENEAIAIDKQVLQFGGALAVIGGLGYFVTLLLHGDLPDQTTEIALEHIAERPEWRALKVALIMFVFCWIGAFKALVRSLPSGLSNLIGGWAISISIVGAAIVVVEYAIIGHALKELADTWAVTPTTDREVILRMAEVMLAITGGLFHSFIACMIGLPYILLGVAVVLGRGYPRWSGWMAVIAGSGALLAGTTRFLGIELVPYPLLYGGFVVPLCIWLALMGVLMHSRARSIPNYF